jgi:clorobiocin biosynthesis protein CloN6
MGTALGRDGLKADLILLHAPSLFDFRDRDDLLFAYLSDSDSVNVTSIYEMFPLGFFSIQRYLEQQGKTAKIVNLASLMLANPTLNVDRFLARLHAPVFGIDLHWMAHCHGSIEIAKRIKALHPASLVIFGGLSSTYYADELIQYSCVDVVVRGYDTLIPVSQLIEQVSSGDRDFGQIPNLVYKDSAGKKVSTPFTHRPLHNYNNVATDWSWYGEVKGSISTTRMIMTLPNSGCAHNCGWCGGSRYSYQTIMGLKQTLVQKDHGLIRQELRSLGDAARSTSIYALQCYSEPDDRMNDYLEGIRECGYSSVGFELFHLPRVDMMRRMAAATQAYVNLSPESHDAAISRLAGRGNYTMQQMEEWIPQALDAGIRGIMVWFFIGMPQQTPDSVRATVSYCERLLKKYGGRQVIPLLCPMVPFLDPGSRFFQEPEANGYRIFHRTLEEHRQAMVAPIWHQRLNYETQWMSRRELQDVTYEAIDRLIEVKGEMGILPASICRNRRELIAETERLLTEMETSLSKEGKFSPGLRSEVREYNRRILSYTSDQLVPMERPFGGRWFDDFTVPPELLL